MEPRNGGGGNSQPAVQVSTVLVLIELAGVKPEPLPLHRPEAVIRRDEDLGARSQRPDDGHDLGVDNVLDVLLVNVGQGPGGNFPPVRELFGFDVVQLLVAQLEDVNVQVASAVTNGLPGAGTLGRDHFHVALVTKFLGQGWLQQPVFRHRLVKALREQPGADRLTRKLRLGRQDGTARQVGHDLQTVEQHGLEQLVPDVVAHPVENEQHRLLGLRVPVWLETPGDELAGEDGGIRHGALVVLRPIGIAERD